MTVTHQKLADKISCISGKDSQDTLIVCVIGIKISNGSVAVLVAFIYRAILISVSVYFYKLMNENLMSTVSYMPV